MLGVHLGEYALDPKLMGNIGRFIYMYLYVHIYIYTYMGHTGRVLGLQVSGIGCRHV